MAYHFPHDNGRRSPLIIGYEYSRSSGYFSHWFSLDIYNPTTGICKITSIWGGYWQFISAAELQNWCYRDIK